MTGIRVVNISNPDISELATQKNKKKIFKKILSPVWKNYANSAGFPTPVPRKRPTNPLYLMHVKAQALKLQHVSS